MKNKLAPPSAPRTGTDASFHRSGAVARMLRMPVATLRVWERRYGLTQAALSSSGQRLYSADDVRRLALLKQLADLGHAIGSLAGLDMRALQQVAATHAQALAATRSSEHLEANPVSPARRCRIGVIGAALAARLQRCVLAHRLERHVVLLGPYPSAAQAGAAWQASDLDVLLLHEPQLHAGWLPAIHATAPTLASVPKAVLYRFGANAVCEDLARAGTALLREPQPDAVLAQWLQTLSTWITAPAPKARSAPAATARVTARRWDDGALADFAGLSSTIACECPRHVAELLVQLSHFETYSGECENLNADDSALHSYLKQVAAAARARFEEALEYVALHEGLVLPPSAPARSTPAL